MVREARDKDRALAQGAQADGGMDVDDSVMDDTAAVVGSKEAYASKLIILHVGSQNLRIGLGTDALPKTIPMVIARKSKENESEEGGGEPSPKRLKVDGEVPEGYPEKWFGEDVSGTSPRYGLYMLTLLLVRKPVSDYVL
jgi:actin-related protein 8